MQEQQRYFIVTYRYLLAVYLLFCGAVSGLCQDPLASPQRLDSLKRALAIQSGNEAGYTLVRIADYYQRLNKGADSAALPYARKAFGVFRSSGNGFGMAWAKFEEGSALMNMRLLDSALAVLQSAKDIPITDTAKRKNELLGTIWNQISAVYDRQGNLETSTAVSLTKALPYFEKAGNQARIASIYSDLGVTFLNFNDYEKAAVYYKKELFDTHIEKKETFYATDFSRLGFCLTRLKRLQEARPCFDSAYRILKNTPMSYPWLKYFYFLGYWEKESGHFSDALANYDQALDAGKKINDTASLVNVLFAKYDLLFMQQKFGDAKKVAYSIKKVNDDLHDTIALNRLTEYKTLWEIEKATGNDKRALGWLEKYTALSDTVSKRNQLVQINDLVNKYQAEKKEKEILQLQSTARQQQLTLNKNRFTSLLLAAGLLITLLLLAGAAVILNNRKKLARQQLLQKENEKQLAVYNAMLEGQEKERSRLSKELHDGLGGMLTGARLRLQSINGQEGNRSIDGVIHQLSGAGSELRRIAHNMMPENLLRFGLNAALRDLCDSLQSSRTGIHFYSSNISKSLPQNEQLIIYRIIQELLNNALKYADATEIIVDCMQDADKVFITVEDNGVGFKNTPEQAEGVGLMNVRNRISYLHGDMVIESEPGQGTTIRITVTVNNRSKDFFINEEGVLRTNKK
ncbi:hypothetical protein A8C56_14205 [Niabella ginsenosidivorans]|uniref:Oxygen sensor histidine kinase NreB n=1 Tax=Niabella ginsenosidivorans TaxID=1176587 RepID=A0A1A9I2S4_9BACT|nr:ATP-binding protein [Niabella ginsenosidivorans]ANH81968.1 hypothetical protein A8C56_14205 [Niabella ginsenosidivorans]